MNSSLPAFMPWGRFRGTRISLLPDGYLSWAMRRELPPLLPAALIAEAGFRTLSLDQQEGRQ